MGFHISGFNVLMESYNNQLQVVANVNATMTFLAELHEITKTYSEVDGLDRFLCF
jgi:hypothetical protein